ncbi:small, acid-soluble spore protein, alpha/beta type [Paenibacillus sp. 32O-W]|uniref:small, acid-soluble spore protein, alpha/beta type n=1 Tax=Paenibacillus sp. 32O-W TaxID=1695218 RepID=UPI0011A9BA41|nr:small, acid-soluble spore protein, alpha/beta type [Paenibacillus sp. 32O-W]
MARRRRLLVPEAGQGLNQLKSEVMRKEGYRVNPARPDEVKYEVADSLGIQMNRDGNGQMKTEDAGKIGGKIGGAMVKEMIQKAKEQLNRK